MNLENIHLEFIIPPALDGRRFDQALAALLPEHSRSRIQGWISKQHITCNGLHYRAKDKIKKNDAIVVQTEIEAHSTWQGEAIQLSIVYEDESLIVLNKPIGIVVHPGAGNPNGTLVNALLHYAPELANLPRAGIIHRLDKDTSGLLIVARTLAAHTALVRQMQAREITRIYHALVQGTMIAGGTIDLPIARHPIMRQKMAVTETGAGRSAVTHYRVLKRFAAHTLLRIQLETGRTHQIRVHMAHHRYPIVGDMLYGKSHPSIKQYSLPAQVALKAFKHQALHACELQLQHPGTGETMSWQANYPDDMQHLVDVMGEGVLN
jgi:23S rRNA pseudouridine1911/1915/1917 synthase